MDPVSIAKHFIFVVQSHVVLHASGELYTHLARNLNIQLLILNKRCVEDKYTSILRI